MVYRSLTAAVLLLALAPRPAHSGKLPVDENDFLTQQIDFSPAHEKHLDERWLQKPVKDYPFARGEIRRIGGILTMTINGRPTDYFSRAVGYGMRTISPTDRPLREQGMRSFMVDVSIAGLAAEAPRAALKDLEHNAGCLLRAVPDATIIVRLWLVNCATDFVREHPDALLAGPDGETDWGYPSYRSKTKHNHRANFLSEWRRYFGGILYRFIELVGASELAPHVAGFYIGAMNTGEWWYFKGKGDPGWDYSKTRQAAFKLYLGKKYGAENFGKLAELWGCENNEELFRLPSLQERNTLDVRPCSRVSDYFQVLNLPVTNNAKYFAKIVKTVTGGKCLAGMEIHASLNTMRINGTVFLNQLLDCPDIDLLGGPTPYVPRHLGNSSAPRACIPSFERHGKIWFSEADFRTHMAYGTAAGRAGSPPLTPQGSVHKLRRDFARGALKHYPAYLMDFGWPWFFDHDLIAEIGELNRTYEFMREVGLDRETRIALVSDQESQLYGNYFANPTLMRGHVMEKLGADYDFYELRDFLSGDAWQRYKLVVFLNIRALSDPERRGIDKVKGGGRTLLWMFDPGAVNLTRSNGDPGEGLRALTGIALKTGNSIIHDTITHDTDSMTRVFPRYRPDAFSFSAAKSVRRLKVEECSLSDALNGFVTGNAVYDTYSADPDAVSLGKDSDGKARFVLKRFGDWTSVYYAACLMSPDMLRLLAEDAGCHIYVKSGDICFASRKFVAIHSVTAGDKEVFLPRRTEVFEVFNRTKLTDGAEKVIVPMAFGETVLLYLGSARAASERLAATRQEWLTERAGFVEKHPPPELAPGLFDFYTRLNPETYYRVMRREYPGYFGPFGIGQTSHCVMTAGPFENTAETLAQIAAFARESGRRLNVARSTEESPDPRRIRTADRAFRLVEKQKSQPLETGLKRWRAVMRGGWLTDFILGIGEGQTGLAAFYVKAEPGKPLEVAFGTQGDARLWINGVGYEELGTKGIVGRKLALSREYNLFLIRLTNTGGNAGFTCRFLEPVVGLKPGQQAKGAAEGLSVYLAPPDIVAKAEAEKRRRAEAEENAVSMIPDAATEDGIGTAFKGRFKVSDDAFAGSKALLIDQRAHVPGTQTFAIDPRKTYKLSYALKGAGKTPVRFYLGFRPFDGDQKPIFPAHVHFYGNTETELLRACAPDARELLLKDASAWKASPHGVVAFDVDASGKLADLPNRNLTGAGIEGIADTGAAWRITLSRACGKAYPAGTKVREHRLASHALYVDGGTPPEKWTSRSRKLEGISAGNPQLGRWWAGTRFAQLYIIVSVPTAETGRSGLLIDGVRFSEY